MDPLLVTIVSFGLIFVVTAALANGLSITRASIGGPLKAHRQLNVMMVIGNFLVLPALLIGLAAMLPFSTQVKIAVVALAVNAGAPFIPWLVSLARGNLGYSVASVLLLTVATIVVLPLTLPPLTHALASSVDISVWTVLWPLLLFIALPMAVGFVVRARWPQLAAQGLVYLGPISIAFLTVHIVLFMAFTWADVKSIGWAVVAFAVVFPLAGMLIGYLLSPPYVLSPIPPTDKRRGSKIVSVVATAQQNTGAAICVAIFAYSKYTIAGDYILIGALTTIVVVMLVMAELGERFDKSNPVAATPAEAPAPAAGAAPAAAPAPAQIATRPGVAQRAQGDL